MKLIRTSTFVPNRMFIRAKAKLTRGELPPANFPPHHVTFWSVGSVRAALEKAGYVIQECYAQSYPEPLQAARSIHARWKISLRLAEILASAAGQAGRMLELQRVNVFAIGQVE